MRLDAMRVRKRDDEPAATSESGHATSVDRWSLAGLVVLLARRRLVVLSLTAVLTIISGYYAFQLEVNNGYEMAMKTSKEVAKTMFCLAMQATIR